MKLVAHDVASNKMSNVWFFLSSDKTNLQYITTIETQPPDPPTDIQFHWDYKKTNDNTLLKGSLLIYWSIPLSNNQRDIKYFQILRRKTINDPFELVKMFDFLDSNVEYDTNETYDEVLVEKSDNAVLSWYDFEFNKSSKYIYTLCSIDAHGLISNYAEQIEISYDQFKNKIVRKKISDSGSPRAYPNLNLNKDLFKDTIITSSKSARTFELFFNPEYYQIEQDSKLLNTFLTSENGHYQISMINLDLQKQKKIKVKITDNR